MTPASAKERQRLVNTGLWSASIALVFVAIIWFPPAMVAYGLVVTLVDIGMTPLFGLDRPYLLAMLFAFAAIVAAVRIGLAVMLRRAR